MIKLFLVLATTVAWLGQNLFSEELTDTLNSCEAFVDSIREKNKNGEQSELQTFEQILAKTQKLQYFVLGFGPSYFDNTGIPQTSYNLYGGRFWQLNDFFSVGASGEVLTEFKNAILFDVALSSLYYPFYSIIMPFGGFSLGPGFLRAHGENNSGAFFSVQLGAIVPKTFPFILLISGQLNVLMQRLPLPMVYSLRIGTAW